MFDRSFFRLAVLGSMASLDFTSVKVAVHKALVETVATIAARDLRVHEKKISSQDVTARASPEPQITWKKLSKLAEAGPFRERGCVNVAAMLDVTVNSCAYRYLEVQGGYNQAISVVSNLT